MGLLGVGKGEAELVKVDVKEGLCYNRVGPEGDRLARQGFAKFASPFC